MKDSGVSWLPWHPSFLIRQVPWKSFWIKAMPSLERVREGEGCRGAERERRLVGFGGSGQRGDGKMGFKGDLDIWIFLPIPRQDQKGSRVSLGYYLAV